MMADEGDVQPKRANDERRTRHDENWNMEKNSHSHLIIEVVSVYYFYKCVLRKVLHQIRTCLLLEILHAIPHDMFLFLRIHIVFCRSHNLVDLLILCEVDFLEALFHIEAEIAPFA